MKTVVLLSGGLDSAVLLAHLIHQGHTCRSLSVDYGQRHRRELESATRIASHYSIPHEIIALPPALLAGSSLTGSAPVPHGHYEDPSMRSTVVPARNTVLLALACAVAVREHFDSIALANHAGDRAVYPDCRPKFVSAFASVAAFCDYSPLALIAPFSSLTKAEIVRTGRDLSVPFDLTYSCYEGNIFHCSKCGTCIERREAFAVAGVPDPTTYAI